MSVACVGSLVHRYGKEIGARCMIRALVDCCDDDSKALDYARFAAKMNEMTGTEKHLNGDVGEKCLPILAHMIDLALLS